MSTNYLTEFLLPNQNIYIIQIIEKIKENVILVNAIAMLCNNS